MRYRLQEFNPDYNEWDNMLASEWDEHLVALIVGYYRHRNPKFSYRIIDDADNKSICDFAPMVRWDHS